MWSIKKELLQIYSFLPLDADQLEEFRVEHPNSNIFSLEWSSRAYCTSLNMPCAEDEHENRRRGKQ